MTKSEIVERIAGATGLTKVETEAVVDGFLATVTQALKDGDSVEIRGFGSFRIRKRNARMARNPRTGESVPVGEHYVPVFKVSKELRMHIDRHLKATEG